jgi:pimeloyl-ACP methyl ester carboxylesterase
VAVEGDIEETVVALEHRWQPLGLMTQLRHRRITAQGAVSSGALPGSRWRILRGEHDRRSPLSIAEQLRSAIPGASLSIVEHVGHVSNMEQPGAFNDQVRRCCLAT